MIRDNDELYRSVDKLILILDDTNRLELSQRLKEAKASSCIATEIFGEIRVVLKDILETIPEPNPSRLPATRILNYINQFI